MPKKSEPVPRGKKGGRPVTGHHKLTCYIGEATQAKIYGAGAPTLGRAVDAAFSLVTTDQVSVAALEQIAREKKL